MTLMEQLTADMKEAMKQGEKERLSVIRLVRGAVRQAEIDGKKTLTDDEVLGVIGKEVKMRRDSIEEFERGGRADLVEKTQAEIAVLMPYLPEQLSADEIKKIVEEVISIQGYGQGDGSIDAAREGACGREARQRNCSRTAPINICGTVGNPRVFFDKTPGIFV